MSFLSALSLGAKADLSQQRVEAAYALQLGRAPNAEEASQWRNKKARSVARVMKGIEPTGEEAEAVKRRAYRDAFGEAPGAIEARGAESASYAEAMRAHVEDLRKDPARYRKVMERAYRLVISRDPYAEEYAYWESRDAIPFTLLVGCIDDWARRNQPGLMVTAGEPSVSVNCEYLTTVRLSPEVAREARKAADFPTPEGRGHSIVAVGASVPVSVGGVPFVAVGAAGLETLLR